MHVPAYVAENPAAFANAYFEFASIRIYGLADDDLTDVSTTGSAKRNSGQTLDAEDMWRSKMYWEL